MEVALANEGATFCSAIEAMLWVEEQAWHTLTQLFASDEQPAPASRLLVQRYGTNTRELTWQRAQVTVGRDRDNDLVIPHPLASRHHARFARRSDGVYLCDLSSTNGTYVNGVPLVGERRLCDQDEIIIADTIIIFEEVTPVA
jgi:pSer/pThr/pTyr-binding forkhead associated (FHA) protein